MEKEGVTRFRYDIGKHALLIDLLGIVLLVIIIGYIGFPFFDSTIKSIAFYTVYASLILLLGWASYCSLKTYFKLRSQERVIIIGTTGIELPEYGDSLNVINVGFSDITELYFNEGRYGRPDNLIIKYGVDGHAYIDPNYLTSEDFEVIYKTFQQALGIEEIEVK